MLEEMAYSDVYRIVHDVVNIVLFAGSEARQMIMTMAFKSPRPRTSLTSGELIARMAERNFSPRMFARSARFSSVRTERAVMATAQPSGFLD